MLIHADFSRRAVVHSGDQQWTASPMAGVERVLLDRVGGEVARATSLVRYAPGCRFSSHTHGGGEEFVVLDGVFQDEQGDYPAGSYVRNPPGTSHAPWSSAGCLIFVKLWQFDPNDRTSVHVRYDEMSGLEKHGVQSIPLFHDAHEDVEIDLLLADTWLRVPAGHGGMELLVLDGELEESGVTYPKLSWLRLPSTEPLCAKGGRNGVKLWRKWGHLAHVNTTTVLRSFG